MRQPEGRNNLAPGLWRGTLGLTRKHRRPMKPTATLLALALVLPVALSGRSGQDPAGPLKAESFDQDPGWEGHNNRLRVAPERAPEVTQDFGYRPTNFAGRAAGELGGLVTRASEPAHYADRIGPVTLDDPLSAPG